MHLKPMWAVLTLRVAKISFQAVNRLCSGYGVIRRHAHSRAPSLGGRETATWDCHVDWLPVARPEPGTWPTTQECAAAETQQRPFGLADGPQTS